MLLLFIASELVIDRYNNLHRKLPIRRTVISTTLLLLCSILVPPFRWWRTGHRPIRWSG